MNKKNTRKGFTIVELVIVIAVIAILATVLVPTFGDVISKANASKTLQAVKNAYTQYVAEYADDAGYTDDIVIKYGNTYYQVTDGAVTDANGALVSTNEPTTGSYYDAASKELVDVDTTSSSSTPNESQP